MENLLVVGSDSVIGANCAAMLAADFEVIEISHRRPVQIPGCRHLATGAIDRVAMQRFMAQAQPDHVVLCGPGAYSCWFENPEPSLEDVTVARMWAEMSAQRGTSFTLISSDAVFTGPWMFHTETSNSFCPSPESEFLRQIETEVANCHPNALILRMQTYGWSATGDGWLEQTLEKLQNEEPITIDCVRHGSPLPAAEIAPILKAAWEQKLTGLFHVAAAERTNPAMFISRLADQFQLPAPTMQTTTSLTAKAHGFGLGETSLQTRRIRREMNVNFGMLNDGLEVLYRQHLSGYRDRLAPAGANSQRVA